MQSYLTQSGCLYAVNDGLNAQLAALNTALQGQIAGQQTALTSEVTGRQADTADLRIRGCALYTSTPNKALTGGTNTQITGFAYQATGSNLWTGATSTTLVSADQLTLPYDGIYDINVSVTLTGSASVTLKLANSAGALCTGTGTNSATANFVGYLQKSTAPLTAQVTATPGVLQTATVTSASIFASLIFKFSPIGS